MSSELQAALIGALIGGGFALLGSVLQHWLSLREDRIKRERQAKTGLIDERLKRVDDEISARTQDILNTELEWLKALEFIDKPELERLGFEFGIENQLRNEEIERLLKEREELLEERKRA